MSELAIKLIEKEKQERKGKLDIGKCGLKAIPQKLFELIWLEELSLCNEIWDYNKKASIHSTNSGSSNIINVEELPTEFKSLTRLKKLYYGGKFLENWKLKKCNILSSLGNLQTLDLSGNKISDYSFLENLTGLQTLDLRFNKISDISFLENLTGLQTLYLRFNKISDISFLENLTGLQTLDLSGNQISDIKPLLPLIKLGAPVSKEYSRTGILIANNPISTPPMYIIEEGREAVISWFEQAEKQGGFDKLFEAKLIIVGEPGAGKTTLMKKLINPEYDLESKEAKELNSTVGINIYDGWTFPTKEYFLQLKIDPPLQLKIDPPLQPKIDPPC